MPLQTTVVGAWPCPEYARLPNWFNSGKASEYDPSHYEQATAQNSVAQQNIDRALSNVLQEQQNLGIDIVTDGEVTRDNYVYHFCRKLANVDFVNPKLTTYRDGAVSSLLPVIKSAVYLAAARPTLYKEWEKSQMMSSLPVKYTIPGPLTIWDSTNNESGLTAEHLMSQIVACINREIRALARAGCKYIQLDEPCLLRCPGMADMVGLENASKCFQGVTGVERTIHLCCGYPDYLDQDDYKKANKKLYEYFAPFLDENFDAISIEDSETRNDLSTLLPLFTRAKVILGTVAVARSRVETIDEIDTRLKEALKYIEKDRLIVAPDCGLGYLPIDILKQKLTNMVMAANRN